MGERWSYSLRVPSTCWSSLGCLLTIAICAPNMMSDASSADSDDVPCGELQNAGVAQWLNCRSRCFGDKGDVEDITEGQG